MAEERVQRRLAAILAADVVGYSRLVEADEAGTVARLKSLQTELIRPTIAANGGRVVKVMGDGVLVEFGSAVDAVRNALSIQAEMARRNGDLAEQDRIAFHVGINIGDTIIDGDDIHGEGVNAAARLEALCEPGEVFVSGTVHDHVEGKLAASFVDLGEHSVKNIAKPVRIYRVRPETPSDRKPDAPGAALALPEKPSIAVLPFANMSGDPEQEYFADGIVEDLITALSRFSWFFVIARNSSFAYKGTSPDVRRVADELGVQYVLEGSVRKAANRVRINAQLIDALSGRHVWAERYDRELDDVFAVQDEITESITGAIAPEFLSAERKRAERKPPENLDAWDYALRGNWNLWKLDRSRLAEAKRLFQKAIELDDRCMLALCGMAAVCNLEVLNGWTEDHETTRAMAFDAAQRATMVDEQDAMAHAALGWAFHVMRRPADAVRSLRRALELNPNLAFAEGTLGLALAHQGKYDDAIRHADRAVRLSPHDPDSGTWMMARAIAPLVTGKYEEYLEWAEKLTETYPTFPGGWRHLTSAFAHLDRMEEAGEALRRLLELIPGDTLQLEQARLPGSPTVHAGRLIEGLRKAGLPE